MAIRYSGSLKLNVIFMDREDQYRVTISRNGKHLDTQYVLPTATGDVRDSSSYDFAARMALSYADEDGVRGLRYAKRSTSGTGWVISHLPPKSLRTRDPSLKASGGNVSLRRRRPTRR